MRRPARPAHPVRPSGPSTNLEEITAQSAVISPKNDLDRVLASQYALISWRQAHAIGLSDDQIYRRVKSGAWERPQPKVYALAGVAYSPERILLAACLSAGPVARAFGLSAAWLWRLVSGRYPSDYEIVVGRNDDPQLRGITVHRFADLELTPTVLCRRVPTTSPLRTIVDLGAVASRDVVLDAIDAGRRQKLFRISAVVAELNRVARRGRDGAGVLRSALDELNVLGNWSPSRLERKARELFRRAGLPDPVCEMVWGDDGEYRLDFYWPQWGLVVEVDGWSVHASDPSRASDLRRQNKLVLSGRAPLRYTWRDIVHGGAGVIAEVVEHARFLGGDNRANRG